jgi:ribosome-binding protein aMBF1 (putative translation factor)
MNTEILDYDSYIDCELCGRLNNPGALFTRIDNSDGSEVQVCEDCANNGDVSWIAD